MLVLVFRKDRTARISAEAILAQGWSCVVDSLEASPGRSSNFIPLHPCRELAQYESLTSVS